MTDLVRRNDDDLRVGLFDALVKRFDVKILDDPSITVVNRMPSAFALSRRGNLLTVTQGIGLRLLRGDLKWKNRREPRTFTVERATIQSRLAIMPDRIEGTPEEILDRIVAMFLEWTTAEEEDRPASAAPLQDSRPTPLLTTQQSRPSSPLVTERARPTARVPQPPSRSRGAMGGERATPGGSTQERRLAVPPSIRETRPVAIEVTNNDQPASEKGDKPSARLHVPTTVQETPTPKLRTYQLLFETTRRELARAQAVPATATYSLIGAGVFVAFTAEAFFNDLGSRVIPSWSQLQRLDPREKAEVLSIELFNVKVNWSIRPFRSVAQALGFRRALAHAHAETLSFDQTLTVDQASEVPRTRQSAWQEHCDVTTIQGWVTDIRLVIELFSRAHDPAEVAIDLAEQRSASSSDDPITRKKLWQNDTR